jgi:hypothetical protein
MTSEHDDEPRGDLVELEEYRAPPPADPPPGEVVPFGADCPVPALGHDGAGGYYFLTPGGMIKAVVARGLTNHGIAELFDGSVEWLEREFGELKGNTTVGFSVRKVGPWLIQRAIRAGYFNLARRVRGAGAWRLGGDALVIHCGDRVMVPADLADELGLEALPEAALPGYRWSRAGVEIDRVIYPAAPPEPAPATVPAAASTLAELEAFLGSWSWGKPGEATLLLGWIGCGMIAGALKWRPHIWIDGPAGAGKSTLEQLLDPLFGDLAWRATAPSEAGVRQELGGAAKVVLLDEMDSEKEATGIRAMIRLAKMASTDNQAPIVRGSAEGKASSWIMRACFYLTSITRGVLRPEDLSRITVLGLYEPRLAPDAEAAAARSAALEAGQARFAGAGPAIRARVIAGYPRFLVNLATVRGALADAAKTARQSDQIGALLAMAATLTRDAPLSATEAATFVDRFALEELAGNDDEREWRQCLDHLFAYRIDGDFYDAGVGETHKATKPVGDLLEEAKPGLLQSAVGKALRAWGLMVRGFPDSQAGQVFLLIANKHAQLERIFAGTRWDEGRWSSVLRHAPGAAWGTRMPKVKFAGASTRATWIAATDLREHTGLELDAGGTGDTGDTGANRPAKPAPSTEDIDRAH